ncbi:hypothetical protein [Candidatus Amarobacter glycogenicus]|uniref:hypothetical protein n=1 Tax=Candidatus Amarobacter glycogenicus TaxID=3140699 RepID=UPI0031359525|nr:hypothetical protein [Dehalococcoidia bacterium]
MARVNPGPLQNRVDPFGAIHAVPERGTMFGNRGGCMHTESQQLRGRPWTNERWICCVLEFKGRRRELMQPGRYTELFFLDEATAFAAGHRPCMECRRPDARRFIEAWSSAYLPPGQSLRTVSHIDQIAHRERIDRLTKTQKTARVRLSTLPDGVFVALDAARDEPRLLWRGRLHRWSFAGYTGSEPIPRDDAATLLTPPSFAVAFAAGYEPAVHISVRGT